MYVLCYFLLLSLPVKEAKVLGSTRPPAVSLKLLQTWFYGLLEFSGNSLEEEHLEKQQKHSPVPVFLSSFEHE